MKCHNLHSFREEWFSYVRVSLKQDEYHIYLAQLSLQLIPFGVKIIFLWVNAVFFTVEIFI